MLTEAAKYKFTFTIRGKKVTFFARVEPYSDKDAISVVSARNGWLEREGDIVQYSSDRATTPADRSFFDKYITLCTDAACEHVVEKDKLDKLDELYGIRRAVIDFGPGNPEIVEAAPAPAGEDSESDLDAILGNNESIEIAIKHVYYDDATGGDLNNILVMRMKYPTAENVLAWQRAKTQQVTKGKMRTVTNYAVASSLFEKLVEPDAPQILFFLKLPVIERLMKYAELGN